MVQTCVVSCYSLAFAGGFGCYLLSMDLQTFANLGPIAGNRPQVSLSASLRLLEKPCPVVSHALLCFAQCLPSAMVCTAV